MYVIDSAAGKAPTQGFDGSLYPSFCGFYRLWWGSRFFSQPQASIADTELAPRCLLSTEALSQAEEVEAGKLEAGGR